MKANSFYALRAEKDVVGDFMKTRLDYLSEALFNTRASLIS